MDPDEKVIAYALALAKNCGNISFREYHDAFDWLEVAKATMENAGIDTGINEKEAYAAAEAYKATEERPEDYCLCFAEEYPHPHSVHRK